MPRRAGRFDPNLGIGFPVAVARPSIYTVDSLLTIIEQHGGTLPSFTAMYCAGLLDSGSTRTLITPSVIHSLHLQPTGEQRTIGDASGYHLSDIYIIDILLVFEDGNIFLSNLEAYCVPYDYNHFHVLVDLDILSLGGFTLEKDYFSFKIDS